MGSPVIVNTFQALGCNPTTTAWTELYSALQLGVCDGLDHVAASVQSMSFYENLGYVCEPKLFITPMFVLFSKTMFDRLPLQYQKLINEAITTVLLPELLREGDKANDLSLAFLKREGKLTYVDCDVNRIQSTVIPVRDKYIEQLEPWVQEIAKKIARY